MILLSIFFLTLINIVLKIKKSKMDLYPFIIIVMILYAGLRFNYSLDYQNYLMHFGEINSIFDVIGSIYEKGYSLLVYLFKFIGLGFNTFLLFISFLSVKMKSEVFKKLSVFPEVSLLLYLLLFYIFNDVEQIRHGISIGFCFYSLVYLNKSDTKSHIISALLMVVGVFFHYSAILFIPVLFVKNRLFHKKTYMCILLISIMFSFINFFDILGFINNVFLHSEYLNNKIDLYYCEPSLFISVSLIIKCFVIIVFLLFVFDKSNKLHRLLFNVYFLGIVYTICLTNIPILMARATTYMRYAELLMIPMCVQKIRNTNKKDTMYKLHILALILILCYYMVKFLLVVFNPEYFHYTSI